MVLAKQLRGASAVGSMVRLFPYDRRSKLLRAVLAAAAASAYCRWHVFDKMHSGHAVVHCAALYFSNSLSTAYVLLCATLAKQECHICRFKARKGAKGDTKGASKVEPYAYWPLDRKMLNRRAGKQAAAKKGLERVVKAAKTGAVKGHKAKRRRT